MISSPGRRINAVEVPYSVAESRKRAICVVGLVDFIEFSLVTVDHDKVAVAFWRRARIVR